MGNFYKKNFRKKSIPSWRKEGKYPRKGAPKATVALGASLFCSRHQKVRKNLIFIHPHRMKVHGGPPLSKKNHTTIIITFVCECKKNKKSGLVALGAVFSIEKVDRDKLI